jgi:predicted  nucleic acid-binding Zn-ribbon protein
VTSDMFPVPQESDSLSSLEERIQRAVQLVARVRQEKEAAVADAAEARAETERLTEEVRALQGERKQVRGRIERLLEQIDELNG